MKKDINAILIHENDNVVTVTRGIDENGTVLYKMGDKTIELEVRDNIPPFHKAAVRDIPKGGDVLKYGQLIGCAEADILKGSHVHDHNIVSPVRQ